MSNAQRQDVARPNPPVDFEWKADEETGDVTIVRFRNGSASEVVIPNEIGRQPVTKIGNWSFGGGCAIRSATLPDGLLNLDTVVFSSCKELTEFRVSANAKNFRVVDGVLFSKDGKTLVAYPRKKAGTEYVVPDGVETLGKGAFSCARALTSVTLPDGLPKLGPYAFDECKSLTSIQLPNGLQSVGERAFWGCEALTSITFPEALQTVGDEAFGGCEKLSSVAFPDALRKVGKEAFVDCPALQSIVLPDGLEKIGKEAFGRFGKKESPWRASKESERQTVPNFTLRGAPGSVAEKYARKNKLRFEPR